ncbi:hypothetical protein [Dactylosporangium sp. CA-139066]|uniref:hypothetical protein n=1 Tax=Dactylosporangium sp. CA-139066 TaxID=3239930 RepID=UPI003D915C65
MPASISFDVAVDPTLYSPLQLRPRAVLGLSIGGMARWLGEHLVPYPDLLGEHKTGVVAAAVRLNYHAPYLQFHDSNTLTATVTMNASHTGDWLRLHAAFTARDRPVADVNLQLRPVNLTGGEDMSAEAGSLPPALLAHFAADELFQPDPRAVACAATLPATGRRLADPARYAFTLYRSHCEVADQWSFIEMVELLTQARERYFLDHPDPCDRLRLGVSAPVRTFSASLRRPLYVFDQAEGSTSAFDSPEGPVFVHTLSRARAASPNIKAWEQIDCS